MSTAALPVTKVVFKDEGKDVLGDVLKDPNRQAISGDTGTNFEPVVDPPTPAPVTPPQDAPPAPVVSTSTAPLPTISTSTAPPSAEGKLYAGKYKSIDDLEKAYLEVQTFADRKAGEAATARKALEQKEKFSPSVLPEEDTDEKRLARINEMTTDPDAYFDKMTKLAYEKIERGVAEKRMTTEFMESWRATNKDIATTIQVGDEQIPLEQFVGTEMARIAANNPEMDPVAALHCATTNLRSLVGSLIDRGRKEALSVQGEATHLSSAIINTPPPTEHPSPAPMSDEQARNSHLDFLKSQAASVRRQVR